MSTGTLIGTSAWLPGADADDAGRLLSRPGVAAGLDAGAALAAADRLPGDRDGVAAHVDRDRDRGVHLVPREDAARPVGALATARASAAGTCAAPAARVGLAEDRRAVPADVHRQRDGRVDLVAGRDAMRTGRPAVPAALADLDAAAGRGVRGAEQRGAVAADVDRGGDGDVHLVAAQHAGAAVRDVGEGVGGDGTDTEGDKARGEHRGTRCAFCPRSHDAPFEEEKG
ncbi:hypothetical protein LUX39_33890 [Actinomadura madurae]|nr:hypothetical protein [Actinomadura madurae]MCQ0018167.1 hypothetical protein [Actinomadura madurae]